MEGRTSSNEVIRYDRFSLNRARQLCALLDRDGSFFQEGDALPRGWHSAMFVPTLRPLELRADGFAGLGVTLPQTDLPRLMFGGRRISFDGDIVIGAPARRESRLLSATEKQGRSGRLLIATVQRLIFGEGPDPVVTEEQDYILRELSSGVAPEEPPGVPSPGGRTFVADPLMLFQYCALTFNTHRIHYDHPYATGVEGYPALVVNGNLTSLQLTELFREMAGREPVSVTTTNRRPLFCDRVNKLHAEPGDPHWKLWAEDDLGRRAVEATIA